MYEKIESIFKIEGTISSLISYLYELELYDSKDMSTFREFLKLYNLATLDEEKIFNMLSKEELEKFKNFLGDKNNKDLIIKYINSNNYNSDFLPFNGRLITRIADHEKHNFNVISFGTSNDITSIKNVIDDASNIIPSIINAVSSEFKDIYLSFIDEYIKKAKYFTVRKRLTKEKYDIIYHTSSSHEKELIKRNFSTDYSLYLSSELSCISKYHNYHDIYEDVRKSYITKSITNISDELDNLNLDNLKEGITEGDIILSYLRIRACMLMLDKESFDNIIEKLEVIGFSFENFNDFIEEDIIKTIINDRKRHKVLSFKRK